MRVTSLRLISFRNYEDIQFDFYPSIILIYGNNGVGKTNIIEAIYASAIGKSHRTATDADMIRFGKEEASVHIQFERKDVPQEIGIKYPVEGRKIINVNGNKIRQKELLGLLNVVIFSPEDLYVIKGSPSERRHFIDVEISQVDKNYYHHLLQYNRALQQRNKILKEQNGRSLSLEEWDIQLAEHASYIVKKRLQSLDKINMLANLMYRKLTEGRENLKLSYIQPYSEKEICVEKEEFYNLYKENLPVDYARMSTTVGPHRDDILFFTNGINMKKYASQGQQRTAVLALKLSELEFIKSETGEYPVLLLDDVLSELDKARREQLIQFIHKRVQTFITTTDKEEFEHKNDVQFIEIKRNN